MTGKPHNNTNPRKFKEKIELLRQKEAQLTANFMEVMRGIPTLTRNVIPYNDSSNRDAMQPGNYSPHSRPSLEPSISPGYTHARHNSGSFHYSLDCDSGTSSRGLYGGNSNSASNSSNNGGGGGGGTVDSHSPHSTSSTTRQSTAKAQGKPAVGANKSLHIDVAMDTSSHSQFLRGGANQLPSPARQANQHRGASQTSGQSSSSSHSPGTYQPNLLSPPPPQQLQSGALSIGGGGGGGDSLHFHPPLPPPPPQPQTMQSGQSAMRTVPYSTWSGSGVENGGGDGGGANGDGGANAATTMIGGMSLMDYRRTYSDSCIPSSFPEPANRRFGGGGGGGGGPCQPPAQSQQQTQQQQYTSPYLTHPPTVAQSHYPQQQQQQQRTLPPVDELTFSRYSQNPSAAASANTTAYFDGGGGGGGGLSSPPRCRHQSSINVSQQMQPLRRLQSDYHSMRNIPQRYAPLNHHHHHNHHQHQQGGGMRMEDSYNQSTATSSATGGSSAAGSGFAAAWNSNSAANRPGGGGGYSSASVDGVGLKRCDGGQFREKQPAGQPFLPLQPLPLQPLPQLASCLGFDNHPHHHHHHPNHPPVPAVGTGYFEVVSTGDGLPYPQTSSGVNATAAAVGLGSCNGVAGGGSSGVGGGVVVQQPLDISALDNDIFPPPEQEGRRDSFTMAVDLLSRLEKRPLDTTTASSPCFTASPPAAVATAVATISTSSPPPPKSAKFESASFYVPIEANDLQILTEPSMANYVTDPTTEDQLVREQYSPGSTANANS